MNKKGASIMIGYVLLVTVAVIMGAIVFAWLKTYAPTEPVECKDGVSIFIKEITCVSKVLTITLTNNGRFSIAGYLIHATTTSGQELATEDLTEFFSGTETKMNSGILFGLAKDNSFEPAATPRTHGFDFTSASFTKVYSLEIVPMRYEVISEKDRLVTCSDAKIKQEVSCS